VSGSKKRILAALAAIGILLVFAALQAIRPPAFVCWRAQFAIFFRNYQLYGGHFLPAFNFQLTDPPSDAYLSAGPLVTWIMYGAATAFGDLPAVYQSTAVAINVLFFGTLSLLAARRWGTGVGLWTLFFAALSKYATRYGDYQTFEFVSVIGVFSVTFLYFEWLETRQSRVFVLCVLAYLVGLAAHYLAFFGAAVICLHWLLFAKNRTRDGWLRMLALCIVTVGFVTLMILLMLASGARLEDWIARAEVRASASSWSQFVKALVEYPLVLLGPGLVIAAIALLVMKQLKLLRRDGQTESSVDLAVLHSLWISGVLTIGVFKNWYVEHPYGLMCLVPFFSVSGALAVARLLEASMGWLKKGLLFSAVIVTFLALSLQGLNTKYGPGSLTVDERVANLSQSIGSSLKSGDRLLVLNASYPGPGSEAHICAFYVLWIPTRFAPYGDWEKALTGEAYTLILSTGSEASDAVRRFRKVDLLANDGDIAFFRVQ
jgi:hypothetical protein